jgi:hypothetical protein
VLVVALCIVWEKQRSFPVKLKMVGEAWKRAAREDAANVRECVPTLA